MGATAAQVAQLRRMTDEPSSSTYTDTALEDLIESYPLMDERGVVPYYYDESTTPPSPVYNTGWIPTYDLNAAARDIWDEKAAAIAEDFTFSADGGSYNRDEKYQHYKSQSRYYNSRRSPRSITLRPAPRKSETYQDISS